MPLVLAQNEMTESGHEYDDVLGVRYEYPTEYKGLIEPEVDFVYYRSRKKKGGGTQPQVYLGKGRIGAIEPSSNAGRLVCQIEDYHHFVVPVPFKVEGRYLEPDAQPLGSRAGLHFRRGVRRIDRGAFDQICALGKG